MYIELIDLLRCPREHEETWLVAAFTKMEGRFIREGKLGCLVCEASYAIGNGIADLRIPESDEGPAARVPVVAPAAAHDNPEAAMRIAAMLGLARPDSLVALSGGEAALAGKVSDLAECRVIAFNPPGFVGDTERVARVLGASRIPLASASLDGIVVTDDTGLLADAARAVKPGGRLVTNMMSALPAAFHELARDENYVVAECIGPLIKLSR